jgi:hypothetical protein
MKLSFKFEEYLEADDSLLPCVIQEIEDKNADIDDDEKAAACKPIPICSEAVQCLDMYHLFHNGVPDQSCQKPLGTRTFYPLLPVNQDSKSVILFYSMDCACIYSCKFLSYGYLVR